MKFPPMIDTKNFLISNNTGQIDKIAFINYAYELFVNDFKHSKVLYKGLQVKIRDKKLDCSVCNNTCSNTFCNCENCPWKNKEDIFQHITSDEDPTLETRLSKTAKKKLKKRRRANSGYKIRTPGIYSKTRTRRINWIKFIIENSNNSEIIEKIIQSASNEEKIRLYNKKENYLVIISRTTLKNGTQELYLNSAYHKPYISLLRDFK